MLHSTGAGGGGGGGDDDDYRMYCMHYAMQCSCVAACSSLLMTALIERAIATSWLP